MDARATAHKVLGLVSGGRDRSFQQRASRPLSRVRFQPPTEAQLALLAFPYSRVGRGGERIYLSGHSSLRTKRLSSIDSPQSEQHRPGRTRWIRLNPMRRVVCMPSKQALRVLVGLPTTHQQLPPVAQVNM